MTDSVEEFFEEKYGEKAMQEFRKYQKQVDEVDKKEIKVTSNLAWLQTMYKNGDCTCGAEERIKCECLRTQEFKDRAKFIRKVLFPEAWSQDPFEIIAENSEFNTNTFNED